LKCLNKGFGYIIYPSYACPDTLIVMDERSMNERFAYMEQSKDFYSDSDIDNMLHATNLQGLHICMDFGQYKDYLSDVGYNDKIAEHIALVDFQRIKPDSLYWTMMED